MAKIPTSILGRGSTIGSLDPWIPSGGRIHQLLSDDERAQLPRDNHFWINYKGRWYQVPDAAVIHDHVNPIGLPIAWLKLIGDYVTSIRCFLPADET